MPSFLLLLASCETKESAQAPTLSLINYLQEKLLIDKEVIQTHQNQLKEYKGEISLYEDSQAYFCYKPIMDSILAFEELYAHKSELIAQQMTLQSPEKSDEPTSEEAKIIAKLTSFVIETKDPGAQD